MSESEFTTEAQIERWLRDLWQFGPISGRTVWVQSEWEKETVEKILGRTYGFMAVVKLVP